MELQAASMLLGVNFTVHQLGTIMKYLPKYMNTASNQQFLTIDAVLTLFTKCFLFVIFGP